MVAFLLGCSFSWEDLLVESGLHPISHSFRQYVTDRGNKIVDELGMQAGDFLIEKVGASVFLGTPLVQQLIDLAVDTVILCGTTTSGCVRATAVEASNYNFHAAVVEEGTFDRFEISHKVSLMDIHAKYGKVMSQGDALEYLKTSAEPSIAK